jgi:hypothetical protein
MIPKKIKRRIEEKKNSYIKTIRVYRRYPLECKASMLQSPY